MHSDDYPSLSVFRCPSRSPGLSTHESTKELLYWRLGAFQDGFHRNLQPRIFIRCFRGLKDPIRVPRIENRVPRIREIWSLQVHTGYLTFSLKKLCSLSSLSVLTARTTSAAVVVFPPKYTFFVLAAVNMFGFKKFLKDILRLPRISSFLNKTAFSLWIDLTILEFCGGDAGWFVRIPCWLASGWN